MVMDGGYNPKNCWKVANNIIFLFWFSSRVDAWFEFIGLQAETTLQEFTLNKIISIIFLYSDGRKENCNCTTDLKKY